MPGAGGPGGQCWSRQDLPGAQVHTGNFYPIFVFCICICVEDRVCFLYMGNPGNLYLYSVYVGKICLVQTCVFVMLFNSSNYDECDPNKI